MNDRQRRAMFAKIKKNAVDTNRIKVKITKKYLIDTNKKILQKRKNDTGEQVWIETTPRINEIMPYVNSHGNSVVEKASIIMGIIALKQPFFDGNRRTGLVAGIKFLHDNGYRLKINKEEQDELIKMLSESKKKYNTLDPEVSKQVSFYISKRIEPI